MTAEVLESVLPVLQAYTKPQADTEGPVFPGAVVLIARDNEVVLHEAVGETIRYVDGAGTLAPEHERAPMALDTIFDMASVTKLFTSVAVMQQVDEGRLELDAPVASYLPAFGTHGKHRLTPRHLLTHTSGLPSWAPLWRQGPDRDTRIRAVLDAEPDRPAGTAYVYSDLNMITLGALAETVSGQPLDALVREHIAAPLGMGDTGFNPPLAKWDRIAATEYQSAPERGMIRGVVHDENAWSLDGVAGHAGVFSTARDMLALARAILHGGACDGTRILSKFAVAAMLSDENAAFPGHAHGLGFELDQRWFMGPLAAPRTAGHTGFTGTSLVIDPESRAIVLLLSNRVHPSREWSPVNHVRRVVADLAARALEVPRRRAGAIWFCDGDTGDEPVEDDAESATLTLATTVRGAGARLGFNLFVDAEDGDAPVTLELSRDDGVTWDALPYETRDRGPTTAVDGQPGDFAGRRWHQVLAEVRGAGPLLVRWRHVAEHERAGRGVYLDGVRLVDADGQVLDADADPAALVASGWIETIR